MKQYKGFDIVKTGKSSFDYSCKIAGYWRWGTIEELMLDIDNYVNGLGSPKRERGFA